MRLFRKETEAFVGFDGEGNFDVVMSLYANAAYSLPLTNGAVAVPQPVYVEISLENETSRYYVQVSKYL